MAKNAPSVVVGIDLAGSPKRTTGLCVPHNLMAKAHVAFGNDDIINLDRTIVPG